MSAGELIQFFCKVQKGCSRTASYFVPQQLQIGFSSQAPRNLGDKNWQLVEVP
jgi:hypothetical protein